MTGDAEEKRRQPGLPLLLGMLGSAHGLLAMVLTGAYARGLLAVATLLAAITLLTMLSRLATSWFLESRLAHWAVFQPTFWFTNVSDFWIHTPLYHERMELYRHWIPFARQHFFSRTRRHRQLAFTSLLQPLAMTRGYYPRGVIRLSGAGPPEPWLASTPPPLRGWDAVSDFLRQEPGLAWLGDGLAALVTQGRAWRDQQPSWRRAWREPPQGEWLLCLPPHAVTRLSRTTREELAGFAKAWQQRRYDQARATLHHLTATLPVAATPGSVTYPLRLILLCFVRDDPFYHHAMRLVWSRLQKGAGRCLREELGSVLPLARREALFQVLDLAHAVGDVRLGPDLDEVSLI